MKYRYIIKMVRIFEYKALEKYFEEMAKNGWMIDSIKAGYMRFVKCERKSLYFNIGLANNTSIIDPLYVDDKIIDYRDFIKTFDYEFVCSHGAIQVFVSEKETQLYNEPEVDNKVLSKIVFKDELNKSIGQFILMIFLLMINLIDINQYKLANSLWVMLIAFLIIGLLYSIVRIYPYLKFLKTKEINRDLDMYIQKKPIEWFYLLFIPFGVILIALMGFNSFSIGFIFIILLVLLVFKLPIRPIFKLIICIFMVLSYNSLNITLILQTSEDAKISEDKPVISNQVFNQSKKNEFTNMQSIFMRYQFGELDMGMKEYINYDYYEVYDTILKDYCWDKVIKEYHINTEIIKKENGIFTSKDLGIKQDQVSVVKEGNQMIVFIQKISEEKLQIVSHSLKNKGI
ncbi:MAG: DUF2812 domain-containing protein [Erysipelotrichaceae bacterium]